MRSNVLQVLTDGVTMIACIVVSVSIGVLPILNSVSYVEVNNALFLELMGPGARNVTAVLLVFGYLFLSMAMCILVTAWKCSALQYECTIKFVWMTVFIGLIVLICTFIWLSYVNSKKCDSFEMDLILQFHSNNTSPNFYRWMRSSKCMEIVECTIYTHRYVTDHCRVYFSSNMAMVCIIVAFLVISIIGIAYINSDDAMLSEEEEEVTESTNSHANIARGVSYPTDDNEGTDTERV